MHLFLFLKRIVTLRIQHGFLLVKGIIFFGNLLIWCDLQRTLVEVVWFRRDGDQKQHPQESHCMVYDKDSSNMANYIIHGTMNEFIGEKTTKS